MIDLYKSLDPTMQLFWACAIISSVVFLIQALLTLLGMDGDMDFDTDFDGDTMDLGGGLSLFSVRSLVNFFVGFGWSGVSFSGIITNKVCLYIVSALIGVAFIYLYFFIKRQTRKLESNGNIDIRSCIGKNCNVYLRIPANRTGAGKIQISINGSVREFPAITDGEQISSGAQVKVMDVITDNTLIVTPLLTD